jgi:hypothetical protein
MIVHVPWKPDRIVQPPSGVPELVGDALQVGRRIENCHGVGVKHTEDCSFFSPGIKICQSLSFWLRVSDQIKTTFEYHFNNLSDFCWGASIIKLPERFAFGHRCQES